MSIARTGPPAAAGRVARLRRQIAVRGWPWVIGQALITIVTLWLLGVVALGVLRWATGVAEWDVVTDNLKLFAVGTYPPPEIWRPAAALVLVSALVGLSAPVWGSILWDLARALGGGLATLLALPLLAPLIGALFGEQLGRLAAGFAAGALVFALALLTLVLGGIAGQAASRRLPDGTRGRRRLGLALRWAWLGSVPVVLLLLRGLGQTTVSSDRWGGLLLTLVLAVVAIAASFPLGVMLALGRRSSLPLIKVFSVGYIEVVRAVPLVTVLFMASIMLPLVLPSGIRPSSVLRALAGLTLFAAAYVAEDVRGGLAAVDRGQYEAATAVGLGPFGTYRLIILPQAIRTVIPAIVGQFISLFKDTSLVIIIGLRELLGIAQAVVNQPEYLGLYREVLIFISIIYFVFSTVMSRSSRRLERELGVERE